MEREIKAALLLFVPILVLPPPRYPSFGISGSVTRYRRVETGAR